MSEYDVIWAQSAEDDLIEIVEYIAADNISAAKKSCAPFKTRLNLSRAFPDVGDWFLNYKRLVYHSIVN